MKKEIKELFEANKVVTFEQIQPFIGDDSETFWNGNDKTEGMLNFLERNRFEIIACRKKGEKYTSEFYVALDKFQNDLPKPEPTIYVSEPALQLFNIKIIQDWALKLAMQLEKGHVEIFRYAKDGFKISFSQNLDVDYDKLKEATLGRLAKEMGVAIVE